MTNEIGPEEIFGELLLMRQEFKGAQLLLEGANDIDRFEKFVDSNTCSITNCYGKPNLLGAMKIAHEKEFVGCIGLADADFDRVLGRLEQLPDLIYSECYDFDMDTIRTEATSRYLRLAGDEDKCKSIGSHDKIVDSIVLSLSPVSHAKLANEMFRLGYPVGNVQWYKFYEDFQIDKGKLVAGILGKTVCEVGKVEKLKAHIESAAANNFDLHQITNGHDFCWALGVNLRKKLGDRNKNQTIGKEVEMHLRLAISESDFKTMSVFDSIVQWEKRTGHLVLKRTIL